MNVFNDWKVIIFACLTLGLAPFYPEPHLLGKIRWVLGGGIGMQPMDWFDFVWHGLPFILLIRLGILSIINQTKNQKEHDIQRID